MDVRFEKIKIKNFLSMRDVEFDFAQFEGKTIVITGENLDVVGAKNGCGKTTLFSAIYFCLYGDTLRTMPSKFIANDNADPKENVAVSLQLSTDNGKYVICRELVGKKKSGALSVWKAPSDFQLGSGEHGDGTQLEELTRSTITETQRFIETELVPCGKEGFLRCILLTADEKFNFFEMSKSAKNDFFEGLFELTVYSDMYARLHRQTLDENNTLIAHSRTIDQLMANIAKLKNEQVEAEKNQSDVVAAEAAVAEAEAVLNSHIQRNGFKVDENYQIIFGIDEKYDELVKEGKALAARVEKGRCMVKQAAADVSEAKRSAQLIDGEIASAQRRISDAELTIKSMENVIKGHSNITNILCSDCLPKYKSAMNIGDFENKIEVSKAEIQLLRTEIAELEEKRPEADARITALEALHTKYANGIEALEQKLSILRSKVLEFKSTQKAMQNEVDALKMRVSNAKYQLKVLSESKTKSFEVPIKALQSSLAESKAAYSESEKTIAHCKALEEVLKPESIRKNVIPDMLQELNFRICGYLSKMGANYTCQFDDDFEATFISPSGKARPYNSFSAGERMRFSIASSLAFKDFMQVRLNIRSNIIVLDEYMDSSLDELSVNGIMDFIRYIAVTEHMAAFVISHKLEVQNGKSDGNIVMQKKNSETVVKIEFNEEGA